MVTVYQGLPKTHFHYLCFFTNPFVISFFFHGGHHQFPSSALKREFFSYQAKSRPGRLGWLEIICWYTIRQFWSPSLGNLGRLRPLWHSGREKKCGCWIIRAKKVRVLTDNPPILAVFGCREGGRCLFRFRFRPAALGPGRLWPPWPAGWEKEPGCWRRWPWRLKRQLACRERSGKPQWLKVK